MAKNTVASVAYNVPVSGSLEGKATATQMPSIPCELVWFKAGAGNTGNVCVGGSGVTVAADATTTTAGFELDAGDQVGPFPASNLSNFYYICSSTVDYLTYIAER